MSAGPARASRRRFRRPSAAAAFMSATGARRCCFASSWTARSTASTARPDCRQLPPRPRPRQDGPAGRTGPAARRRAASGRGAGRDRYRRDSVPFPGMRSTRRRARLPKSGRTSMGASYLRTFARARIRWAGRVCDRLRERGCACACAVDRAGCGGERRVRLPVSNGALRDDIRRGADGVRRARAR